MAGSVVAVNRRRDAKRRLPVLECGLHSDPWPCRCTDPDVITDRYVDGFRDAAQHLLDAGLAPAPNGPVMRVLWRRGGHDQRLAVVIAESWEVAT